MKGTVKSFFKIKVRKDVRVAFTADVLMLKLYDYIILSCSNLIYILLFLALFQSFRGLISPKQNKHTENKIPKLCWKSFT